MLTNHGLEVAIDGNRGATVLPEIEYRKMRALESIAETLLKLAPEVVKIANPIIATHLEPVGDSYQATQQPMRRLRRAQGETE